MTGPGEAELRPLNAAEEPVWRDLARFFVVTPRLLDEDLQRGANMALSTYSVLSHLSDAPDRTLRITDLANGAYLSGSRTTRLVDELVADGLVVKQRAPSDARGVEVILTAKGLERLQGAYPVHLASVRSRVMDHVPSRALPALAEAMREITKALG